MRSHDELIAAHCAFTKHFEAEWPSHGTRGYVLSCYAFIALFGIIGTFLIAGIIGEEGWGIFNILLVRIPGALLGVVSGMTVIATREYLKKRLIYKRFQTLHPDAYRILCERYADDERGLF